MIGQSVGSDASPLSCFLFRPRKKARKAQETQSYQRFQCIGHTDFKGLSNAVINTHPLLPSMGTTRQKSSCRNRLQNGPHSLLRMKVGYTLAFANRIAHSGLHAETGVFRTGPLSLPSERSARSQTSPGRVSERRTLPLWGLGREVLSKNAESLRNSDALRRVAVPKASRPRWAA